MTPPVVTRTLKASVLAWVAFVVPIWLVFVLCTYWEPILRDGWGPYVWHRHLELSLANLWAFAKASYVNNNPRVGQLVTLLQYAPGPWHPLCTPIFELGLFYSLTALMLGRWPSWRRSDDALLFAMIVAAVFATTPVLGAMLFYRPFSGNYVAGLLLSVLWLLPYRFHVETPGPKRLWRVPAMLILGGLAGLANEHTAPAFVAAALAAIVWWWRRGERFVPWAIAGLVGMIAGAIALYVAPGQDLRYDGLATQGSLLDRIVERGWQGNAWIIGVFALQSLPLVAWLGLGAIARKRNGVPAQVRPRVELVVAAMAILVVLTLFASPKQGHRLFFAPVCLAAAATAHWTLAQLGGLERRIALAIAAATIAFVSWRLLDTYYVVGREFDARMTAMTSATPGSIITVPPYSRPLSRWFLGDDFILTTPRSNAASAHGLGGIVLGEPPP